MMKKIKIIDEQRHIENVVLSSDESTILQVLEENKTTQVHAPCGGKGTCKKCLVYVKGRGEVLACQTMVEDGMEVVLKEQTEIHALMHGDNQGSLMKHFALDDEVYCGEGCYGIACDIGTTTIVCYLVSLQDGKRIGAVGEKNAQEIYGADVISRIAACQEGHLSELHEVVTEQIVKLIEKLCNRQSISTSQIMKVAISGNTVMCHLFMEISPESIGVAPFLPKSYFGEIYQNDGILHGITASVYIAPAIAGYVGGDITADLLSIQAEDKCALLLDIGTNGEMALCRGDEYLTCAVAAGPAFEGAAISMGMSACDGAISKVWYDEAENRIQYETIGECIAKGFCGSGLLDILAVLLELELIDETGCFAEEDNRGKWFNSFEEEDDIICFHITKEVSITQEDIRKLQMAKAAVAAGIYMLKEKMQITDDEIDTLYLAGGFGNFLNPASAAIIGMIPEKLLEKTKCIGNAAGEGAVALLLSEEAREVIQDIKEHCEYMELSTETEFSEQYIENMYF